jgi:protocatechuate 3,4-dioxygenase beta subunit
MHMRSFTHKALGAITLAIACSLTAVAHAQQIEIRGTGPGEQVQFPMPGRQFKTGTGRITGRVLAAETGNPIRRAQVRISGPDIMAKSSLTDAEGRFEFRDLPSGRFTLSASKSGFVQVQYGQTRPFESGRPIELAEKQVLENADIQMPRGSVIAGRIVDEFGEPVPDVNVTALRQSWSNGRRRMSPAPGRVAQTNDLGQFRLYGLPPGDYYISATLRSGQELMAVEMAMAARLGGDVPAGPSGSNPTSGYAPTYFPGTPSVGDAQRITLAVGQEIGNADFALMPVRLARISGIVLGSEGKPLAGAMVTLAPNNRTEMAFGLQNSARTNSDGAFTISNVAPGDYQLQTNEIQVMTSTEGGNQMVFSVRTSIGGGGGGDTEFGSIPLVVAGEDVANLVVTTTKGATVTGKVAFEGGAKPPALNAIRISATPPDGGSPVPFGGGGGAGSVKADGTFELKGVAGSRLIRVAGLPPGWTLKSVRLNGTDITDTGGDFKAGDSVTGLEVTLTSQTTSITGSVTGPDGTPLKDYTLVVFADDPELWKMPMSRWVTGVRPDQDGRFKVQNMPPGSYHAVAVDYIPSGEWGDPELLEKLKGKGKRFTLEEGSTETLELKLSGTY